MALVITVPLCPAGQCPGKKDRHRVGVLRPFGYRARRKGSTVRDRDHTEGRREHGKRQESHRGQEVHVLPVSVREKIRGHVLKNVGGSGTLITSPDLLF